MVPGGWYWARTISDIMLKAVWLRPDAPGSDRGYTTSHKWREFAAIFLDVYTEPLWRLQERANGARGRSRTADTVIFSHVLYQLSYPGIADCAAPFRGQRALEARLWRRLSRLSWLRNYDLRIAFRV